jgi:hypothetical protein
VVDDLLHFLLIDDQLSIRQAFSTDNLTLSNLAQAMLGTVDQLPLQSLNLGADVPSCAGA